MVSLTDLVHTYAPAPYALQLGVAIPVHKVITVVGIVATVVIMATVAYGMLRMYNDLLEIDAENSKIMGFAILMTLSTAGAGMVMLVKAYQTLVGLFFVMGLFTIVAVGFGFLIGVGLGITRAL